MHAPQTEELEPWRETASTIFKLLMQGRPYAQLAEQVSQMLLSMPQSIARDTIRATLASCSPELTQSDALKLLPARAMFWSWIPDEWLLDVK